MQSYYSLPIQTSKLYRRKALDKVEIRKAVHQNISLLLKSFQLSYAFDPVYGCVVNKYQGATPDQNKSNREWREEIRESIEKNLLDMLRRYENRIEVEDVIVRLVQPKRRKSEGEVKVKVQVKGRLSIGRREKFYYPDSEIVEEAQEILPLVIPVGKR